MRLLFLAACLAIGGGPASATNEMKPRIGMPNPASKFCLEQGGRLEIRDGANGQVGFCRLPDGRVIEEWEFFHANQPSKGG